MKLTKEQIKRDLRREENRFQGYLAMPIANEQVEGVIDRAVDLLYELDLLTFEIKELK